MLPSFRQENVKFAIEVRILFETKNIMRKSLILSVALAAISSLSASAQEFFDTSNPENLFNLGVRVGINTATRNINNDVFDAWSSNTWGIGFDAGVVADINFKDYISVQPGLFFESRSNKFTYCSTKAVTEAGTELMTQFGKDRSYNLMIPIMCSVHFNIAKNVRWNVEAGPYFDIILKNSLSNNILYPVYGAPNSLPSGFNAATPSKFDFGFKFGTSIKVYGHYLFGIHYEAGCLKPWKDSSIGGRNKAWTFTIGYDL